MLAVKKILILIFTIILFLPLQGKANSELFIEYPSNIPPYIYHNSATQNYAGIILQKLNTLFGGTYKLSVQQNTVLSNILEQPHDPENIIFESTKNFPNTLFIVEDGMSVSSNFHKLLTIETIPYILYHRKDQNSSQILENIDKLSIGYVQTYTPIRMFPTLKKLSHIQIFHSYQQLQEALGKGNIQAAIVPEETGKFFHFNKQFTSVRTPVFHAAFSVYIYAQSPLLHTLQEKVHSVTKKPNFFPLTKPTIALLITLVLLFIGVLVFLIKAFFKKEPSLNSLARLSCPEIANYALCCTDDTDTILHISPEIKKILGYEQKTFIGRALSDILLDEPEENKSLRRRVEASEQILSVDDAQGNPHTLYLFPIEHKNPNRHYYIMLDATPMLQNKESITTQLQVYNNIFSKAPIGIVRCALDGSFIHANTTFKTMLHLHTKDISEHSIYNTLGDNIQTLWEEILKNGALNHKIYHIPKTKMRDAMWVIVYATKLPQEEYIDIFLIDITSSYTTYGVLEDKTEQLNIIIENLPDPTFILNENQEVIVWNKALEKLTGVSKTEILGKRAPAYSIPFYGHAHIMAADHFFNTEEHNTNTITFEIYCPVLQNGKHLFVSACAVYDYQNKLKAVIQTVQDITPQKEEMQKLEQTKRRYTMVVEASNAGVWEWNFSSKSLFLSQRCYDIFQIEPNTTLPLPAVAAQFNSTDLVNIQNQLQLMQQGVLEKTDINVAYNPKNSTRTIWLHVRAILDKNSDNSINGIIGSITDITEQKDHENIARIIFLISSAVNITHEPQDLFKTTHSILMRYAKYLSLHVVLWNNEQIEYIYALNENYEHELPPNITAMPIHTPLLQALRSGKHATFQEKNTCWLITPLRVKNSTMGAIIISKYAPFENADVFFDTDKELMNAIGEQIAIAIERYKNEEQLTEMALHDPLTGLPNRALMSDRLEHAIRRAERNSTYRFAVFMLDLDRFKLINDTHGHNTGDLLLIEIATRLKPLVRSEDTIARLGGDEFAILLENVSSTHEVLAIAKRILKAIEMPLLIDGKELRTATSIGIVLDSANYNSAHALLRDADIAMYDAKTNGKGRFRVFDQAMHQQMLEYVSLETDLSNAIKEGTLSLVFQPIIRSDTKALLGFEALVRWNHPEKGFIPPSKFIPIAEENGLIVPLGNWVLEKACSTMKQWVDEYPDAKDITISVNLSAKQAVQSTLKKTIMETLEKTQLNPEQLKLEITETTIMGDPTNAMKNFAELREMGIKLAIDDFGTGYSSMSYLQNFPVNTLKIDGSFVKDLTEKKEGGFAIVQAICALAHGLGIDIVAEGVETEEQANVLLSCKCEAFQGYLFSKPLPEEEAKAYMFEHTKK